MSEPKKPEQPPMNPLFDQLQQQAARDEVEALQTKVRSDQASMLARYGTRLAIAGATGTQPLMSPSFGRT